MAVLGRNGCGKSTLAKHCNAIALPEGGTVTVFGMDTQDEGQPDSHSPHRWHGVPESGQPDCGQWVEEDVAFAPENLGVPSQEIRRRVDEALRQVGLYEYREHAPHLLSGGQKQRVAIAGVIAMRPSALSWTNLRRCWTPGTGRGYGDCLRLEPALGHHRRSHHPPHG